MGNMQNKGNTVFSIIFLIAIVWGASILFKKDTYIGFYYPDANDLTNDIQSDGTFESLDACRDWVNKQVSMRNQDNSNYDYECGKNCDISGGKPYVCEETLE